MLKQSQTEVRKSKEHVKQIQVEVESQIQSKAHQTNTGDDPQMHDAEESDFQPTKQ